MKYIRKRQEPPEFKNWKEQANSDWQPDFRNLAGKPKEILIKALMTEQGEICCYCESRLVDGKCHIEHFKPQSDPSVDPLDYANLLCSCQANLTPSEPRHCGNLKDNLSDENLLISPLNPDCESHFAFNDDGTIKPAQEDVQTAINTIEKLGLNLNKLKVRLSYFLCDQFNLYGSDQSLCPLCLCGSFHSLASKRFTKLASCQLGCSHTKSCLEGIIVIARILQDHRLPIRFSNRSPGK